MDKSTSVLAALDAGKLPTTQQLSSFVDWINTVGITHIEPRADTELSAQGRVLAGDLRTVLDAYKQLGEHNNGDNIIQQAIFHLTQGELTVSDEAIAGKDAVQADYEAFRDSLRTLLNVVWSSFSTEGTSIFHDLLSILRLSIADAAEMIEGQAGKAKESLRHIEKGVQDGDRDTLGRDKQRLEDEKDVKVAWQHGMDTVKDAGTSIIGTGQSAATVARDQADKTTSRLQDAFYKICDRAQSDPEYCNALDTLFSIVQKRLNATMDPTSDPNATLSSFIVDPTPEQHLSKALSPIRLFLERLCGLSLEPILVHIRSNINNVLHDQELKTWFNDFLTSARKNLGEAGYARSEEAEKERCELRAQWHSLLEKDEKWKRNVEEVKSDLQRLKAGLLKNKDLQNLQAAHRQLGSDIEQGLVDASAEAQTGVQAAVDRATWFWQDLFKVYIPRFLSKMHGVPIPRTEYKDEEIEFVLENLDVSSFNILPSHVYIRNITDIDISTSSSPQVPSKTAIGTLTHISVQALKMKLDDVSFWYKDKNAGIMGPSEFTGLLGVKLPEKGVDVDLKIRLIPATETGPKSRASLNHFHVIEAVNVNISEDVDLEVKESNHPVLVTLFKSIMVMRIRDALSRTLSEQLRAVVEWADGVAYDVGKRQEVFHDTGLGGSGSLAAAIFSEVGRLRREGRDSGRELGWSATGTGLVVQSEQFNDDGELKKKATFAMGAEPQILSGDKRGPLGYGSESVRDKVERLGEAAGVNVSSKDVKNVVGDVGEEAGAVATHAVKEGKKQVQSFRQTVVRKRRLEAGREGWESAAFDL